ncbi:hypothetical protein KOR34_33880 [Posidoniimonas corsicana]|uniref:DUF3239 domain-containing protein n=1 Tax=Posidoniimonas corsicana TaxID=1938618 RepID=A0A5C5V4T7_9BACT|nr:DUF3239 domain-containing protein [Posidoniimonas corsicana]TWT33556.1 hypothetical protein KOR34_33880 [Posidoniimonas corsicana]
MPQDRDPRRIRVTCPHCGASASAPAEFVGRRVKCAAEGCRQSFELRAPADPPPERPQPSRPPRGPGGEPAPTLPQPPERTFFQDTVASNPGEVRFNPIQWQRHHPLPFVAAVAAAVVAVLLWVGLTMAGHSGGIPTKDGGETPIWLFAPACLATLAFFTWTHARRFKSGDANPGVVVALNPTLLAVATDLTQGAGEFPAVRILRINLKTSAGEPLRVGSRVPTVALYAQPHDKQAGHWSDFAPVPVEYGTSNPQVVQRVLASFPDEQYDFLEHALSQIEQPFQPGLYALWSTPGKAPGRKINKPADF